MPTRNCRRCQATNPAVNRYCGRCGAQLAFHTIVFAQDENDLYRVETHEQRPATAANPLRVGRAVAVTATALAAEAALAYVERRWLRGRNLGRGHVRQLRNGALSALAGAALLYAEQSLGSRGAGR